MFAEMGVEQPDFLVCGMFRDHHQAFPEVSQQWLRDLNCMDSNSYGTRNQPVT